MARHEPTQVAQTAADVEARHKAEHGNCARCDGTGFEPFERGGYKLVRKCVPYGPPIPGIDDWVR